MFCKVCRSAEPGGSSAACALAKRVRLDVLGRHARCKIKELTLCVTDRAGLDLLSMRQLTTLPGLQGDELRLAESELLAHLVRDHRRVGQFTPVHPHSLTNCKVVPRNLFCTAPQPMQRSGPLLSNAPP